MKICVCLDKKNGMMFFGKRQSQDAVQREQFLSLVGDNKLWMSTYSAKLFGDLPNVIVDDNYSAKAGPDDYCFIDDQPFIFQNAQWLLFTNGIDNIKQINHLQLI